MLNRRALLSAALGLTASGCYGKFALTRKLYEWNGNVGGKFVNTLLFYVLIIIPVYEVVMLVDFLVLNLIEFWAGSDSSAEHTHEDGSKTRFVRLSPDVIRIIRLNGGREVQQFDIELAGKNAAQVRGADGKVLAAGEVLPDNGMVISCAAGVTRLSAELVQDLEAQPSKVEAALKALPRLAQARAVAYCESGHSAE